MQSKNDYGQSTEQFFFECDKEKFLGMKKCFPLDHKNILRCL